MIIYTLIGLIWTWWLENFTTKHLEGVYGRDWKWNERIFHLLLWPISLGKFLIEFITAFFK